MKKTASLLTFLFFAFSLFAQVGITAAGADGIIRCGTDEYWKHQVAAHPELLVQEQHANELLAQQRHNKGNTVSIIPVVFHIIHNNGAENVSKADILAQLQTLNQCYRGVNADTSGVRSVFKN